MSNDKVGLTETLQAPRPSSPRKFFARIYGHLEDKSKGEQSEGQELEEESDVEIGDDEGAKVSSVPLWPTPPPLPVYPRPMLLPHQQLAFGAGLAAFCEYHVEFINKH
ncbi:unnamed protein product [Diatraea saccharalis]|uniref:Uncharacterized protein n=1 Tax=Diatraea saccharalis TaxID=40085 RepID=A0A9N9R0X9_9NEOP|nr:unnamed protein product [Diatraea saccharalis]